MCGDNDASSLDAEVLMGASSSGTHCRHLERVLRLLQRVASPSAPELCRVWLTPSHADDVLDCHYFLGSGALLSRDCLDSDSWHAALQAATAGLAPKAAMELRVRTSGGPEGEVIYCVCQIDRPIPDSYRNTFETALGHALMHLRGDRMAASLDDFVDQYRDLLADVRSSGGELPQFDRLFCEAADRIGAVTGSVPVCVIGYDLRRWRKQREGYRPEMPLSHWLRCEGIPEETRSQIVSTLLAEVGQPSDGFGEPNESRATAVRLRTNHPVFELLDGLGSGADVWSHVLALYRPTEFDRVFAYPFLCVLVMPSAGNRLTDAEHASISRFLKAFGQIVRLRDMRDYSEKEEELAKELPSIGDPQSVSQRVVRFLSARFDATEVVILERQGNFLSILAQEGVSVSSVPPLYVHTKDASLVCLVARQGNYDYSPDVSRNPLYLSVVPETRSQLTVPLVRGSQNVGVMLIGLGVPDGLFPHDQDSIFAIAGECAECITATQQIAERQAILHTLKDNLPIALSYIGRIARNDQLPEIAARDIAGATRLLSQSLRFVNDYAGIARAATAPLDIVQVVKDCLSEEAFARVPPDQVTVLHDAPEGGVMATASRGALLLAVRQVVANAFEAMGLCPTKANEGPSVATPIPLTLSISYSKRPVAYAHLRRTMSYEVIGIHDEGPGIPEAAQDMVMEYGYTTKAEGEHMGGGLSIARRAMESFGGKITFESEEGHGATFSLWVPMDVVG